MRYTRRGNGGPYYSNILFTILIFVGSAPPLPFRRFLKGSRLPPPGGRGFVHRETHLIQSRTRHGSQCYHEEKKKKKRKLTANPPPSTRPRSNRATVRATYKKGLNAVYMNLVTVYLPCSFPFFSFLFFNKKGNICAMSFNSISRASFPLPNSQNERRRYRIKIKRSREFSSYKGKKLLIQYRSSSKYVVPHSHPMPTVRIILARSKKFSSPPSLRMCSHN